MNKGKVLLVCYYFPPLGLAGITRPLNLFKYLPQHGYECHVLTVKPVAYRKYEPELLEGLDQSQVFRSGSRDPQRLMYLLGVREVNPKTIERGAAIGESLFPDSKIGWVAPAVRLGKKLNRQHSYEAIISTSPPISSHLVGMKLSQAVGVPWVADFRDFWTSYPIDQTYRNVGLRQRATDLLDHIKRASAARVAVNQSIAAYVSASHVITNGFDPAIASEWRKAPSLETFGIGLLGTFNDILPVEPLLRVLDRLRSREPEQFKRVRLCQVGAVDRQWLSAQLEKYEMQERVTCLGLQPRLATVQYLADCVTLYLAVTKPTANVTPSRVYDALASGRRLLAHAPSGSEIEKLLANYELAHVFTEDSIDPAVEWLSRSISEHWAGVRREVALPDSVERYSWDRLAGRMAALLDEVTR